MSTTSSESAASNALLHWRPSLAPTLVLGLLLLFPSAGMVLAASAGLEERFQKSTHVLAWVTVGAALIGFVGLLVTAARAVRDTEIATKHLIRPAAALFAVALLAGILNAVLVPYDRVPEGLTATLPGAAAASALLALASLFVALRSLSRARPRVLDERGFAALLIGLLSLGTVLAQVVAWSEALAGFFLFPVFVSILALVHQASAATEDPHCREEIRRDGRWVLGLSIAAVVATLLFGQLWFLAQETAFDYPVARPRYSTIGLAQGWLFLAPVGLTALVRTRTLARSSLLALALLYSLLFCAIVPSLRSSESEFFPLRSNSTALLALGMISLLGLLFLLQAPRAANRRKESVPGWVIAALPCALVLLSVLILVLAGTSPRNPSSTDLYRLQALGWVGTVGALLACVSSVVLGLRAGARSPTPRAGARGVVALVVGLLLILISALLTAPLWDSNWGVRVCGPLVLNVFGLVSAYLAARGAADNEASAVQEVLLTGLATFAGLGLSVLSVAQRLDLSLLAETPTSRRMWLSWSGSSELVGILILSLPLLCSLAILLGPRARIRLLRQSWKAPVALLAATLLTLALLFALGGSAVRRALG